MANSSSSSPDGRTGVLESHTRAPDGRASAPEYVGFWKRFVAFLIDSFIVTIVLTPLMMALYGTQYFDVERQMSGQAGGAWDWLVNIAFVILTIVFWRYRGATPGKIAISAKIVDEKTGAAASTGRLVVRFFAYFVSTLPLMLGFAWIGIDRKKQGFHDKIAGTVVVYDDE